MLCTRSEFDKKFANNELKIAFIGMSNIGKSHRSKELAQIKDFTVFGVDEEMADKMQKSWPDEMAEWMGYPFEERFPETQKTYLEWENKLTGNPVVPEGKNFILDTTGSVVYLTKEIHKYIFENYLVVQLDASESMLQEMEKSFFVTPKTIVGGNLFNQNPGELGIDALRRCYPKLLRDRIDRYRSLADVVIPGEISRSKDIDPERFWEILRLSLKDE